MSNPRFRRGGSYAARAAAVSHSSSSAVTGRRGRDDGSLSLSPDEGVTYYDVSEEEQQFEDLVFGGRATTKRGPARLRSSPPRAPFRSQKSWDEPVTRLPESRAPVQQQSLQSELQSLASALRQALPTLPPVLRRAVLQADLPLLASASADAGTVATLPMNSVVALPGDFIQGEKEADVWCEAVYVQPHTGQLLHGFLQVASDEGSARVLYTA